MFWRIGLLIRRGGMELLDGLEDVIAIKYKLFKDWKNSSSNPPVDSMLI